MKTVKVQFKQTYTVRSVDGPTYLEGSVYEMREDIARHFTLRGRAVLVADDEPTEDPVAPEPVMPPAPEEPETIPDIFEEARVKQGISAPKPTPKSWGIPEKPLVSCIMPTKDRRGFIAAAIDCWRKQTYRKRELIILDDGEDPIEDLVPDLKGIRYLRVEAGMTTGAKRNYCCEQAQGELIAHFDDDDWSAPDRLAEQVARLQETGKPITGFSTLLCWDVIKGQARRYSAGVSGYVCGTTLCYLREYWEQHPFPDKQVGSDNAFIYPAIPLIASTHDEKKVVARIHDRHTADKQGLGRQISKRLIPSAFWKNEKLRLG